MSNFLLVQLADVAQVPERDCVLRGHEIEGVAEAFQRARRLGIVRGTIITNREIVHVHGQEALRDAPFPRGLTLGDGPNSYEWQETEFKIERSGPEATAVAKTKQKGK